MPWAAGYQTTVAGVDEARLDAHVSLLTGKITHLDAALSRDLLLPVGTAVAGLVILGDPALFPAVDVGPFLICVMGGGKSDAVDAETVFRYIGVPTTVSAVRVTMHTQVRAYLHPDLFEATDSLWASIVTQTAKRERLLARIADWLRLDCFGTVAGIDMTLTSQETTSVGDNLTMGFVREIRKGRFEKSFAGQFGVMGVEFHIEHILN